MVLGSECVLLISTQTTHCSMQLRKAVLLVTVSVRVKHLMTALGLAALMVVTVVSDWPMPLSRVQAQFLTVTSTKNKLFMKDLPVVPLFKDLHSVVTVVASFGSHQLILRLSTLPTSL